MWWDREVEEKSGNEFRTREKDSPIWLRDDARRTGSVLRQKWARGGVP